MCRPPLRICPARRRAMCLMTGSSDPGLLQHRNRAPLNLSVRSIEIQQPQLVPIGAEGDPPVRTSFVRGGRSWACAVEAGEHDSAAIDLRQQELSACEEDDQLAVIRDGSNPPWTRERDRASRRTIGGVEI